MSDLATVLDGLTPEQRDLFLLRLNKLSKTQGGRARTHIPRQDRLANTFPLSFAQQSLWFLDQLQPGAAAYNIPQAVRLEGPLDIAALQYALNELVHRHEALRTSFTTIRGEPVQVVMPEVSLPLPIIDIQHLPPEARESEAQRLATEEALRSFDLTRAPLLRAALVRLSTVEHVMLLTTHHIVSDGWSMGVLVRDLAALYTIGVQDAPDGHTKARLPELPIQYADFAVWQQQRLQGELLERQLAYWKQQLGGKLPVLQLPLDRPRPAVQTFRGAHEVFSIPPSLTEALRALSQQEGTTLFMTLLAAFQALLYRYSGQEDVVVGSPNANRNHPELEGLIGSFSDILVLRADLSGNPSFREALRRVREMTMKAYANQDVPFTKVVEVAQPERNLSYNPLFQVMFSFLDAPEQVLELPEVTLRLIEMESGAIDFDLFLTLSWRGATLSGSLGYNIDLFETETISRMLADFLALLEVLVADPDRRFADVPLLRRQMIAVAATFTAEPVAESLSFWLKQLDLPTRVTFAPYNQVFQQLLDPAGLLASNHDGVNVLLVRFEDWLRFNNAANDDTQIEHNLYDLIQMVQAAAARSATPYLVCIGPASPGADPQRQALFTRLEALLVRELGQVTGVYVVTSDELAAIYPVADYYDPHTDAVGHVPFTLAGFAALGTLLARKISTLLSAPYKVIVLDADQTLWKGVCGEDGPQGVVIDAPRRALQEFMVAQHDAGMLLCLCSKNAEEDVAAVFEFHHEMPLQRHHFVAWAVDWRAKSENIRRLADELQLGRDSFIFIDDNPIECAEVHAACPEMLVLQLPQDPEHIPAFLRHIWAFDHLKLTREDGQRTALYQQNRERERARREAPTLADFLASLDLSVSITTLRPAQHARVAQLAQRTNQFNATTIRRTEGELRQLELVGKECLCVEVSDRFGDYGLVGVIIFETTAAAIEVDTFLLSCRVLGRGVEQRMLARLAEIAQARGLERVDLHYTPSPKNQPVANFLNWVGEPYQQPVDAGAIYQIPVAVAAAAPGRLLAEPAPAAPLLAEKSARGQPSAAAPWRGARQARLAATLHTPDQVLAMIEGPRRLRAGAGQTQPFIAPRGEAETLLADMWAKALHLDQVGIYDNFFDLGGHSLLATQIISQVQQTFEVALSLQNFFEAPTIARMTERIELLRRLGQEVQAPPIRPVARDASITTELPLSFAQQRLWFISQLEPDSPAYNIPQAVRLSGRLDVAALERALSEIVRRHEALRTTFAVVDGQPVARVGGQPAAPALPIIDLGALPEAGREAEAGRIVEREIQRPFDLARGPLLRAGLLRLGEREHILVLTMHHIVTDAWSLGVFVQELATLYEAFASGRPSPLPDLPIQYADFATWQQQWLQGDVLERQLIYWKQQLSGAPPVLGLPADRPRPPLQTFRGAYQPLALPRALADALLALSQREQVTLFMTLLAAFDTLLYRYTGQTDIVVGTPIANRQRAELAGLIGFFANTLVLRTDLAGDPSFRELLHRVREITLGAYDHQDLPFERLVSELQPERDLSYNPLFQVMFVFQNAPLPDLALSELTLSQVDSEGESTRFDLVFHLWEAPEGIGGILTYSTDLFDAATIEQMLKRFETLLEGIAANPEARISRLPLMSIEERQQATRSATLVQPRKQLSEQLKHRLLQTVRSREV